MLNYNIYLTPPCYKQNDYNYKNFRTQYFIHNVLNQFDIIGLEEVYGFMNLRKMKIINSAIEKGYDYYSSSSSYLIDGVDGGLLLLSKYPITIKKKILFRNNLLIDRWIKKGVIYCKILIKNQYFNVFLTHTQATYTHNPSLDDPSVQVRLKQIKEMRDFIEEMKRNYILVDEPIILMGDFNINGRSKHSSKIHSDEYLELKRILLKHEFKDALFEVYNYHPVTYGDITVDSNPQNPIPFETELTDPLLNTVQESLDYIFYDFQNNPKFKLQNTKIEKFLIRDSKHTKLTQLSGVFLFFYILDHFGITTNILF